MKRASSLCPDCAGALMRLPADLLKERLVHLENADPTWEDWTVWFHAQGIEGPTLARGQRVNSYIIALQAAVDGLGIALGWRRLVESHLRQGLLVPAIDAKVQSTGAYYQMLREGRTTNANVDGLRRWIANEASTG